MDYVTIIALLSVVLIGLPHGAMDGAVAIAMGYGQSLLRLISFLVIYILIAMLVVGVWLWQPQLSLFGFLLLSIWHFGRGDSLSYLPPWIRYIQAISHGGLVVLGISQFDRMAADQIFQWLVFGNTVQLWVWIDVAMRIWLPIAAIYLVIGALDRRLWARLAEWIGLGVLIYVLPALVAFAVYFCLIHTIRHVSRIMIMLNQMLSPRLVIGLTAVFTVASWLAGIVIYTLLLPTEGAMPASMMVVFIGLAALTVPHSLLIDSLFRPRFEAEYHTNHHANHNGASDV